MKTRNLISALILVSILISCTKEIELSPSTDFTGDQFIESILFPGEAPKVYFSRSLPFFSMDVTPQELFIRSALVTIAGPNGTETLQPDSTFDKFRCRWLPFYGGTQLTQYGATYDLTIQYNNEIFTASTTIDQPKPVIENVEYIAEFFDLYGGHDGVVITFTDAVGSGDFYRFQMHQMIDNGYRHVDVLEVLEPCVADGEFFQITDIGRTIFSDENVDGQQMQLFIEVAFEYVEDDVTYVFLQSIDKNSAEFYRELDEQFLARVNPFVEPVFLNTKIDGAIGVFGSAVLSDSVMFVYPTSSD